MEREQILERLEALTAGWAVDTPSTDPVDRVEALVARLKSEWEVAWDAARAAEERMRTAEAERDEARQELARRNLPRTPP